MKGYEYIAKLFHEYGVEAVFYQEAYNQAITAEAAKYGIKGIMAHTENAAGFMADGYARVSGKPGVAMAQAIGTANLAAGVVDAWLANTPVVALTGMKTPNYQNRNSYQETDHQRIFSAVTKWNAMAMRPEDSPRLYREAFREAVTGRQRPVHLDTYGFTGAETEHVDFDEPFFAEPAYGRYPAYRLAADLELIKKAAKEIGEAKKPVLVLGRGVFISGAGGEALELAELCDMPVVTTPDGKSSVNETSAYWAGIVGNYGMDCANRTVRDADLVIFVGTGTSDQTTLDWTTPDPSRRVIQIDIAPEELGRNYPNCLGIAGDAKTVLSQLLSNVVLGSRLEWRKQVAAYLADTVKRQRELMDKDETPIHTGRLCAELAKFLPDDAILVSDTGYSAVWSSTMIRVKPGQTYIRAAGSLGWAVPASIGAKVAKPERPVICFTGDGGFYYHLAELETAVRNGVNTVVVINNNGMLAQCLGGVLYRSDPELGKKALSFSNISFAEVACALGAYGQRVESGAAIGEALRKALASGRPSVVEVITNPYGPPRPPVEK